MVNSEISLVWRITDGVAYVQSDRIHNSLILK